MYALKITAYSHIQIYEYAIKMTNHIAYIAKVHIQKRKKQRRERGRGQTTERLDSNMTDVHAQSLKHMKRKLFGHCCLLLL